MLSSTDGYGFEHRTVYLDPQMDDCQIIVRDPDDGEIYTHRDLKTQLGIPRVCFVETD